MREQVILVDKWDNAVGSEKKLAVHKNGLLHRAFSVFVLNSKGELLLQKRSLLKYHTPGLWSNTCCSHPRPGEDTEEAAHRRLREEMGFDCILQNIFQIRYELPVAHDLAEHEYNHIYLGRSDQKPRPDPTEVADFRWVPLPLLHREMRECPGRFTPWFELLVLEQDLERRFWAAEE